MQFAKPTLSFDFVNSRQFDGRLTFSRTSSATRLNKFGVMETVPAGTPRIDYGYDLNSAPINLLWPSDPANSSWAFTNVSGAATRTGNRVTLGANSLDRLLRSGMGITVTAGAPLTAAVKMSGSGNVRLVGFDGAGAMVAALSVTLTGTPTTYVLPYSATAAGSSVGMGIYNNSAGTAGADVTLVVGGIFNGTLSAAQIDAAGGIPITEFAPSSEFTHGEFNCKGLLIETAATNLISYSNDFKSVGSNYARIDVSTSATELAPDGSAAKLVYEVKSGSRYVGKTYASSSGAYCASVFVKPCGRRYLQLYIADNVSGYVSTTFDTLNGTFAGTLAVNGGFTTPYRGIQKYPNGWYRVFVAGTQGAGTVIGVTATFSNVEGVTGDGKSGFYMFGMQLEAGTMPTSYIPTTSAQVTRADDYCYSLNVAWGNNAEWVLVTEFNAPNTLYGKARVISGLGNNQNTQDRSLSYVNLSGGVVTQNFASNASYGSSTLQLSVKNNSSKFAYAAKPYDFAFVANGETPTLSQMATLSAKTAIGVGRGATYNGEQLNGHIRSIRYFPVRLTNAELQSLTV